jgi:hypothetical protein
MSFEIPQSTNKQSEGERQWLPKAGQKILVKRSNGQIEDDWIVDYVIGNSIVVKKPKPGNSQEFIYKRTTVDKLEQINDQQKIDFLQAENLDDLYKLINLQNGLRGGAQDYTAAELISLIDRVKNGELDPGYVTRTNNLRAAVIKIVCGGLEKRSA